MDFDLGRPDDRGDLRIAHASPREPQPFLADTALEIAEPTDVGTRDPAQRPRTDGIGRTHWPVEHLQMRDNRDDLAVGNVELTAGEGHGSPGSFLLTSRLHAIRPTAFKILQRTDADL
jgi:hypothetical protein